MKHKVSRNLFIGLGGTGSKVLIKVKKALADKYGVDGIPPSTEFLVMDTDIEMDTISSDSVVGAATFNNNEKLHIPIKSPHTIIDQDRIKFWLPNEVRPLITPSANGARQLRPLGRFAFVENFSSSNILGKIENKIDNLKSANQHNSDVFEIIGDSSEVMIHLVFSPCGGTGAGVFMDVIMALRHRYERENIYAWMVMPDMFKGFPFTGNVTKNAYAALMEIDHIMGKDRTDKNAWSNYDHNKHPYITNPSGTKTTEFKLGESVPLFNYIYLFDKTMMEGSIIHDIDGLYDRIARTLFFHVTDSGAELLRLYNNNDDFRHASNKGSHLKRRSYSSMGLSQLIIDREYLVSVRRLKAMTKLVESLSESSNIHDQGGIDNFIDSNGFREDQGKDNIIDKLFSMSSLSFTAESIFPASFEKGCNTQLKENAELYLNSTKQRLQNSCNAGIQLLQSTFLESLQKKQNDLYSSEGGLIAEKQFLNGMLGSFKGMKDEIVIEIETHASSIQSTRKLLVELHNQIVDYETSFSPFGKSNRIKTGCVEYAENFYRLVKDEVQKERKSIAENFYIFAINILERELGNNRKFASLLDEVSQFNFSKLQVLLNAEMKTKDFEIHVHEYLNEYLEVNKDLFGLTDAYGVIKFYNLRNSDSRESIITSFETYIDSTELIKEINTLELEDLLGKLPKGKLKDIIERLDKQSEACIKLNQTFSSETTRPAMTDLGMILVPDVKNTIFKVDSDVTNTLANKGNMIFGQTLKLASSNDRDRITFLKIKGMFPASALHNIDSMKSEFTMSMESGGYHFSDVYFEKYAMDLLQGQQDKELLKLFAIGGALQIIGLDKGAIKINIDNVKVPLVEGSRNRNNRAIAFECFAQNKEWQDAVKKYLEYLDKKIDGKPIIAKLFKEHYDNINKIEVLGKKFESVESGSAEYNHIHNERASIQQAAIEFPIKDAGEWGAIDYGNSSN